MKQNKTYKTKNFKSEFNKTIIWGARSKTQLNNNCSPKLYNKDFTNLQFVKETRDNIDQVIPVSHIINFNEDIS